MKTSLPHACIVASLLAMFPCRSFAGGWQWTVVAWNNLGMHCMDDDYSVFSILGPHDKRIFRGPMLPPDMPAAIQSSGDLINWSPATILTSTAAELKARDTISASGALSRFIRLNATRQTPNP